MQDPELFFRPGTPREGERVIAGSRLALRHSIVVRSRSTHGVQRRRIGGREANASSCWDQ